MPCYAQVNKTRSIPHDAAGMVIVKALTSVNVSGMWRDKIYVKQLDIIEFHKGVRSVSAHDGY